MKKWVLQYVQFSGFGNRLGAFMDVKLAVDVFKMGANRVQADHDLSSNLVIGEAIGHQL